MAAFYPIHIAKVGTSIECIYYEAIHGSIVDPFTLTCRGLIALGYIVKVAKVGVDSWITWKGNGIIRHSPFYVCILLECSAILPYRMRQIRDWMANQTPIVPYIIINVMICGLYFFSRVVADRGFPTWRVTTALFCVQFMTDVVAVSPTSYVLLSPSSKLQLAQRGNRCDFLTGYSASELRTR